MLKITIFFTLISLGFASCATHSHDKSKKQKRSLSSVESCSDESLQDRITDFMAEKTTMKAESVAIYPATEKTQKFVKTSTRMVPEMKGVTDLTIKRAVISIGKQVSLACSAACASSALYLEGCTVHNKKTGPFKYIK